MINIPESSQIIAAVRTALVKLLPPEDLQQVDITGIDEQTALLSLPIDSAVLMALMTELEDTFTVFIDEESAFAFASLGDLTGYIRQRLTEKARRLNR